MYREVGATSEDEMMLLKEIREDIDLIKRYTKLLAWDAILTNLNKIASSADRKQIWRLADGTLSTEQIANQIGVTVRSVQYFVQEAESAGLIRIAKRGYPKRIEDVIPSEWKPWKPRRGEEETEVQTQKTETKLPEGIT